MQRTIDLILRNRPRRLRKTPSLIDMLQETRLSIKGLIYPVFVCGGRDVKEPIASMPGQYRLSIDVLLKELEEIRDLGIPSILLFGIPDRKDSFGSEAYDDNGIVQNAVRAIKENLPDVVVITDVCLCAYTDHGHCGLVKDGKILNDETLEILSKVAVSHADAGADIVAPSAMMDGQVKAIREALDHNGFKDVAIMSYSAKYASSMYGPFRDAAESSPKFGDRRGYQMNPANVREAIREVRIDIEEGADIVMVKPALSYLDVISRIRSAFDVPLAAYNVSGEYSMIKAASERGWIDEKSVVLEILTSIKRAGADLIITYFAKDVAKWLKEV